MSVDPSAVTAAEGTAGPAAAPAKETVGKYRLDRVIGTGGMGVVWAAFNPDLERSVALKLLRVEATEPTMRTRLLREARAMARLRHPNVVTVFDVGTDSGRDYIAMELVEGGTLDEWLESPADAGRAAAPEARRRSIDTKPRRSGIVEALLGAGRGLAAAHTAGLVHRDFKPHNVLRAADGHVYVTDFGLARGQIEEDGPAPVPFALPVDEPISGSQPRRPREFLDSTLTQTGVLIGTPAYMAPEQFGGGIPGPKSDQFAFCVTAWQALTGERPFRGSSIGELEAAARGGPRQLVADLPVPVRAVLERGLDPSPEARWPDMPALLAALAAAFNQRPPAASRRWVLPAALGAVLLAGGGLFAALGHHGEEDNATADCEPAEDAFAPLAAHQKSLGIGSRMVLTQLKRAWIQSYTEACSAPRTEITKERIDCLIEVRDDLAKSLEAPDEDNGMAEEIGGALGGLASCDPNVIRGLGQGFQLSPLPPSPPPAPPSP